MAEYTKETTRYPDGTVKEKCTVKESAIESTANAVSKTIDNASRTLQGKSIDTSPKRLQGS